MKKKLCFILWLSVLSLLFCTCDRKPYPQSLIMANNLADTYPDSAITLLQSLKKTIEAESKATQMYYHLLCIKASDKAYLPHTSDSLILSILNYYVKERKEQYLPEVYYYAGRIYRDLGDAPQALEL